MISSIYFFTFRKKKSTNPIYTNIEFDCIFPDETFPFGTPYDECITSHDDDDMADEFLADIFAPSRPISSPPPKSTNRFASTMNTPTQMDMDMRTSPIHIYQKIDGCYIRCDILDAKIFDAVVQLKDVHMHRSRYEANLIRARANRQSESTINTLARKKFRSAYAIEKSRIAIENNANSNDNFNGNNAIASTSNNSIRTKPTSATIVNSHIRAHENNESTIADYASPFDSNENTIGSVERKVRPVHMRSPMPKFIVTKVTEKEKSKETVKFDIRNELKIVRKGGLNTSYDSLKSTRKLTNKEISDAQMMVQLQRRKSLQIFNSHDDTDATDSETDGLRTHNVEVSKSSGSKTIYTIRNVNTAESRTAKNDKKVEIKTKLFLHRSNILAACGKLSPHKRLIIEHTEPREVVKRSAAILMAETTDVDSEYERNALNQRRKSQRQRQRSKKVIAAAESEPELIEHSSEKQTNTRRSYVTDVTDFDTDTDGEAFYSTKRRRKPNKKYQDESPKESKNKEANKKKAVATPSTPKKPRREYKPRQRKTPEERKKSPVKTTSPRKSRGRPKRNSVVEITDLKSSCEVVVEQESSISAVTPLPSKQNLQNSQEFNSVPHKKTCIGKAKSDISTKIRTQDMLYSTVAKLMRRYSCYAGSRAPIDLLHRVISQRETLFASERKSVTQKGKRRGRKRKVTTAVKKRPDFTKKLLDSPDFSSLIDIARLNQINVDHPVRDDDDDSGPDVGDIEQQLSVIRRGQHLGSLQTMSSPLAHIKLLKAGRTVQTRKSNIEKRKPFETLITRVPLTNLKGMELLMPTVAANNITNEMIRPATVSTKNDDATNEQKTIFTFPANDKYPNTMCSSNTVDEKTNKLFTCESNAKDDSCEIELITVPSEMVVEHVYDEEDIESPVFEPHVSNQFDEQFNENVDFSAQQVSKTRVRTKRTRGRIRWTKPRKRPPIKYQPCEDTLSTDTITYTPPERNVDTDRDEIVHKSPPKILNSLPIQRVVAPTTRGRKRKNDTLIAPMVTVKSVTQKRGRYTRQETTKTLSLSIEPVNVNEM